MPTYTVTRVMTRPNTSIEWPNRHLGINGYANLQSSGKVSIEDATYSDDGLVQTTVFVWASKEDYIGNLPSGDNPDPAWLLTRTEYNNYIVSSGITSMTTGEDGTVRIFNSSNNMWELQE